MSKKGQNPGQIFVYILSIVIVGLILLFGYRSIAGFKDRTDDITLLEFRKNMEGTIKRVTPQFGRVEQREFLLGNDYKAVCFVENGATGSDIDGAKYPMIKNSVDSDTNKNVFLITNQNTVGESYEIGVIHVVDRDLSSPKFDCYEVSNGKLTMNVTGKGNKVEVNGIPLP